jgi:hypothetical protein
LRIFSGRMREIWVSWAKSVNGLERMRVLSDGPCGPPGTTTRMAVRPDAVIVSSLSSISPPSCFWRCLSHDFLHDLLHSWLLEISVGA